jgi:hypothetical protein
MKPRYKGKTIQARKNKFDATFYTRSIDSVWNLCFAWNDLLLLLLRSLK